MRIFQCGINGSLMIGRDTVVTVLEIQSNSVRLGINDPNAIPSYWEETLYLENDDGESDAERYEPAYAVLSAR
jgi:carbon storage regulator CsrA